MDEVLVGQRAVPKTLLDLSEDDYQLYLKDDRWRVYDVRIEGVSFVSTYRTEFSSALIIRVSSLVDMLRQRTSEIPAVDTSGGVSTSPRMAR